MPGAMPLLAAHKHLLDRLCQKAQASASAYGGLSAEKFAHALERSVEHRFQNANPAAGDVAAYLESLHLDDLALACACSYGSAPAWEQFVARFRPDLLAAARAICRRDDATARELADSIYAELFGVGRGSTLKVGGKETRKSLFDYFNGRSKLSTWLRAILAQRYVDSIRASRKTESLEEEEARGQRVAVPATQPCASDADPEKARYLALLQVALTAALAALAPRDRLRLAYYYLQELTLAQIGRLLGEHEATVSRHLERTRRHLREQVERALRAEKQLSDAQIHLCYEYAQEEWPFDLTRALSERE